MTTAPSRHLAAFYDGDDGFVPAVLPFVREALDEGAPAFVAVPGDGGARLRGALGDDAARVAFADMAEVGRNPGRIIPAIQRFLDEHAGEEAFFVGQPIWAARCPCELREATHHESLLNVAFAGRPVTILCPYDALALDGDVIADAERTHPVIRRDGRDSSSPAYLGPATPPPSSVVALPPPPADAETLAFASSGELAALRRYVGTGAERAGLDAARVSDAQIAVSEVMTNSVRHGGGEGVLRVWSSPTRLMFQVDDRGSIADPLVGRRAPAPDQVGGWGLLLAHRLCDLVEVRSGGDGTTVRLHMAL